MFPKSRVGLSMAATAGGAKFKSDAILSLIEERVKKVILGKRTLMFCSSYAYVRT